MLRKFLTLCGKVLFRVAFAGFIVLQLVVFVLLLWGISHFLPEDNDFVTAVGFVLILTSPFLVGAGNYLIFQRMTRLQYVLAESERWLAARGKLDASDIRRRYRVRRWLIWTPALSVLLFCLFLDETWPPTSHLLHPRSGKLIGYQVPIPFRWTVIFNEPDDGRNDRSYFYLNRWGGTLRAGIDPFIGRRPSMTASSLGCSSSSSQGFEVYSTTTSPDQLIGTRTYTLAGVPLNCAEFLSKDQWTGEESHIISCLNVTRDFSCYFSGKQEDVADVYRMMQGINRTK